MVCPSASWHKGRERLCVEGALPPARGPLRTEWAQPCPSQAWGDSTGPPLHPPPSRDGAAPVPQQSQAKPAGERPQRSKKAKEPKAKVKKLKYHQYVPPDHRRERGAPPMDSAYARILQQQQLFLQLQILTQQQQHYNYQTILPAPPKYAQGAGCWALGRQASSRGWALPHRGCLPHRPAGEAPGNAGSPPLRGVSSASSGSGPGVPGVPGPSGLPRPSSSTPLSNKPGTLPANLDDMKVGSPCPLEDPCCAHLAPPPGTVWRWLFGREDIWPRPCHGHG